jgi:hypothetical protein
VGLAVIGESIWMVALSYWDYRFVSLSINFYQRNVAKNQPLMPRGLKLESKYEQK